MRDVIIAGAGMTRFGKYLDLSLKTLSYETIHLALKAGGVNKSDIQAAFVGNAAAGSMQGQEMIVGQVVLKASGIDGIPIFNIENACASSSAALQLACLSIASGMNDCVLVHGVERLSHKDKTRSFHALLGAMDTEEMAGILSNLDPTRSYLMDVYANSAKQYMARTGATAYHLASIASKNHMNGSRNPYAQYRRELKIEDILRDRLVVEPFTRSMCAPISDGAATIVLCSREFARKKGIIQPYIYVDTTVSLSASSTEPGVIKRTAKLAYEKAGLGPKEIDVFEIHDTTAAAELMAYEDLGMCAIGEGLKLVEDGTTCPTGKHPVNVSGGLLAKGHPIGATGLGQIIELYWLLKMESPGTQIHSAKTALAQNAGGHLGLENAVCGITILKK